MRIASYADNLKATENCIQGLHQPPLPQANGLYSICKEMLGVCICGAVSSQPCQLWLSTQPAALPTLKAHNHILGYWVSKLTRSSGLDPGQRRVNGFTLNMANLLIIWKVFLVLFRSPGFGPSDQSLADFPILYNLALSRVKAVRLHLSIWSSDDFIFFCKIRNT